MPRGTKAHDEEKLSKFLESYTNPTGLWHNLPAYTISLLKAYYGTGRGRKTIGASLSSRGSPATIRISPT